MPQITDPLVGGFSKFAQDKNMLGRAWLFGSRALNRQTEESDWDIAIELRLRSQAARELFFEIKDCWTTELRERTGLRIDLELHNTPETPNVTQALHDYAILFYFPWDALIHEAAHVVIGTSVGNREQGIVFGFAHLRAGDMAGAAGLPQDPEIGIKRSLAGIIAHYCLCPSSLPKDVVEALKLSVIPSKDHPHRILLLGEQATNATGAQSDIELARAYAENIHGNDPGKIDEYLQICEKEVRSLVTEHRKTIELVARDVNNWLRTEEPEDNAMMLYPPNRALAIIEKSRE